MDYVIKKVPGYVFWKDKDLKNAGCNENFSKQVGFERPEDVVGKTDYELPWTKSQTEQFLKDDREIMYSGVPKINFEETQRQLNGEEAILLTSKVPLRDKRGEISGILGIYIDITERKKNHEELKRVEYQLEGAKLVSASIAHELRTPLATIKSGMYVVKKIINKLIIFYQKSKNSDFKDIKKSDISDLEECITLIDKKTDSCNNIINMLLSKLKYNKNKIESFEIFSASCCLENTINQYRTEDSTSKITFIKKEEFQILGDNIEITQIIMNLLKNASFYIKKAGKGEIKIWLERKNEIDEIHFKDTAFGIKSEVLPHIFDPLFTTEQSTGTGIGLWFCKESMESHQGSINCFSEEGEYTEFVLSFPKLKDIEIASDEN